MCMLRGCTTRYVGERVAKNGQVEALIAYMGLQFVGMRDHHLCPYCYQWRDASPEEPEIVTNEQNLYVPGRRHFNPPMPDSSPGSSHR